MAVLILILKIYCVFIIVLMSVYSIRHYILTGNRLHKRQRIAYGDIYDSELPYVSVLIPMHNEEKVLNNVLSSLLECDYDKDRLEIIAINDHSDDKTAEMLDAWHEKYSFINVLHRIDDNQGRGKMYGLNDAMEIAKGDVIIIFDADYTPSTGLVRKLAMAFIDPTVGAVMGRVIPRNATKNRLTSFLNLERIGGYQVDMQARYNLGLIAQYGGTVGGFRKDFLLETNGFNTRVLAEDTELTMRLYTNGYRIVYDNSAECYEEVPETWKVRGRQIRRWSRGHNAVMFRYLGKTILSKYLTFWQKVDGCLFLICYVVPLLFVLGMGASLTLFFLNEMNISNSWLMLIFIGLYNTYGNFAAFYEISSGAVLDGIEDVQLALPMLSILFYYNMWHISLGFFEALLDLIPFRKVKWNKTERFEETSELDAVFDAASDSGKGQNEVFTEEENSVSGGVK